MSAMGGSFHGRRVADLFAGSGALGLECLSRGAESCVFVERAAPALRVLETNVAALGAEPRATVVRADVLEWLDRADRPEVDLALADPPYGRGLAAALARRWAEAPFADELWLEHRSDEVLEPTPGLRQRRYGDTILSTLTRSE
jgi:16S rRNA (guanine966-N2)-methyltransferase